MPNNDYFWLKLNPFSYEHDVTMKPEAFMEVINELNQEIESTELYDFCIHQVDTSSDELLIYGKGYSYGHDVEVRFKNVDWINLPLASFDVKRFEYSSHIEGTRHHKISIISDELGLNRELFLVAEVMDVRYCSKLNQ